MKRTSLTLFQRESVIGAGYIGIMLQNIGLRNTYQRIVPAVFFGIIAVGQQSENPVIERGKMRVNIREIDFIFHQIEPFVQLAGLAVECFRKGLPLRFIIIVVILKAGNDFPRL